MTVDERIPEPARNLASFLQMKSGLSKIEAAAVIHDGAVRVNGRAKMQMHCRLEVGDRVEFEFVRQPVASPQAKKASRESIQIVYEDESIVVVTKPSQLLTVPTLHREKQTLQSAMTKHIRKTIPDGQSYCVHRLDRGVSGLLVMAKSLEMAERIRDQFAARKPERQYVAIVLGSLDKSKGTIQSYLATDENLNRYSIADSSKGELAITHYEVAERLQDATIVTVRLETGRRNQIRVHMAEMGHPILGDPRYGRHHPEHPQWTARRLALHAESLGFRHPLNNQPLSFRSSWPNEFRDFRRRTQPRQ